MDSSFFSQQIPYFLTTLLVYMALIDPIMSILEHKIEISSYLFSTCVGEGENAF